MKRSHRNNFWIQGTARLAAFALFLSLGFPCVRGADAEEQIRELRKQNEQLQQQLKQQQAMIEALSTKISSLEAADQRRAGEISSLKAKTEGMDAAKEGRDRNIPVKVQLSGQAAIGIFETGREGQFPNSEFRVDEARLFLDAQAWEDIYGFLELNLITREDSTEGFHLGEAYVDVENVFGSKAWDHLLNVRAGRFFIPFGEEYQVRYPIYNPLILHSLSDIWGVDEGIELYGSRGKFQYAAAVQNGGHPILHDFTGDKSIAGRVGFNPAKSLHFSASAMRTGDLSAKNDQLSEVWFANGFFRSIGDPARTGRYHADLVEGDAQLLLSRGHLKTAGGYIHYDDDDSTSNNRRDLYYYYLEGLFDFTKKIYGAARFSQVFADHGYPLVANGQFGEYFFQKLTSDLWRVSVGAGYRPNQNFIIKLEYAIERGEDLTGEQRDHEDFLGGQIAIQF